MYLRNKAFIILLIFATFLLGCENSKIRVNVLESGLNKTSGEMSSVTDYYCFRDEIKVNNNNYKVLLSNTELTKTNGILGFSNIPTDLDHVESAQLKLFTNLKPEGEITFKIKKINQPFDINKADYDFVNKDEETAWNDDAFLDIGIADVTYSEAVTIEADSIMIDIPAEEIINWKIEDSDFLCFLLTIEGEPSVEQYMEFDTSVAEKKPCLTFKYTKEDSNEEKDYEQKAPLASYIVDDLSDLEDVSTEIRYRNMSPIQTYLKFDENGYEFKNEQGEILSDFERRNMTFNKAVLRLYLKEHNYFDEARKSYLIAYRVKDNIDTDNKRLTNDDLEYLSGTSYTQETFEPIAESDTVQFIDVKITPLLQAFVSGIKDNNGIVIKSNYQYTNQNFDEMLFYGNEEENYKPKIIFEYTLPLDEDF